MYIRTSQGVGQVPTAQGSLAEFLPVHPSAPRVLSVADKIHPTIVSIPVRPPRLLDEKDHTLYVEIPLGLDEAENRDKKKFKVKPVTGIFIPDGYKTGSALNLILYLHGHTYDYPGDGVSIEGYWDARKFPFFDFRKGVTESGKNVILVAPTLGPLSQAGGLPFWPDVYLDQVIFALMAHGPYKNQRWGPLYANIILACHSGGGSPMRKIALRTHRYAQNIRECWGFDSLYGAESVNESLAWAQANPTKNLYIYYCDYVDAKTNCTSTRGLSQILKRNAAKLPNVSVEKSPARGHFLVPLAHWTERIKRTTFLPNR